MYFKLRDVSRSAILSILFTTKKILLRTYTRFILFFGHIINLAMREFFSLWFTARHTSLAYRAAPISKKIAQQKWTPFRLTEGEKEKGEERWPVYTQAFVPFFYLFSGIKEAIAHLPSPFNLASEENNSATTKLDHVGGRAKEKRKYKKRNCLLSI